MQVLKADNLFHGSVERIPILSMEGSAPKVSK